MKRILIAVLIALCLPAPAQAPFQPLAFPVFRALDSNGKPLNGGKLYTYVAGTTTPLATYTDATGTAPNSNPVILDSTGTAPVFLSSAAYKFILQNQFGVVQWTVDNIVGSGTQLISVGSGGFGMDLSALSGCPTLASGSPSTWTVTQLNCFTNGATWSSPLQFGTISNGSTSTITLSGTSGSGNLTLSSSANFGKGQGIMIAHAGAVCGSARGGSCNAPPTPSIATAGTAGSTTYTYQLACVDGLGGGGTAGTAGSISTGNATLAGVVNGTQLSGNYNVLTWMGNSTCTEVAIYRNGAFITSEYSAPTGTMTFNDMGLATSTNRDIPATPPTIASNDNYVGMITAFTGTTATVIPNLGASVASVTAYHSDTPLIQAAINASPFVSLPRGTYLVNYPIDYTRIEPNPGFSMSGAIIGPGKMLLDTGDIALDVTGDNNIVLSGFTMLQGPTAPAQIAIYCSRDTTDVVSQNILTDHLMLGFGGNVNALGGRGAVGMYNHACEIQHNYDDQFQVQRWTVLTAGNIDNVSSPFDPEDDRGSNSMSEVEFHSANGGASIAAELENAYTITFIGGYVLGGESTHPWAFEVDPGQAGRFTVDKFRVEGKGGLVDVAAGAQLNEPYFNSDVYRVILGLPQIRLNSGATITDADMIRSDDYGGSGGSISALVDGTNCAVATSIMRLGQFETIGTCQTSGAGNTISGTLGYDRSLQPNYQFTASPTPSWVKLGTWISNSPSIGASLGIKFYTGAGFTAGANNQAVAEAIIRNANGSGSTPNLSGASVFSYGAAAITGIKVVATGSSISVTNQSWDVYIDEAAFANGNYIIEKAPLDQWINIGTIASDPGAASSTVVVGTVIQGVTKTCTVLPTVVNGIITSC